jgi:hypothetical protein
MGSIPCHSLLLLKKDDREQTGPFPSYWPHGVGTQTITSLEIAYSINLFAIKIHRDFLLSLLEFSISISYRNKDRNKYLIGRESSN